MSESFIRMPYRELRNIEIEIEIEMKNRNDLICIYEENLR